MVSDGSREQDTKFILVRDESLHPIWGWRMHCTLGFGYSVAGSGLLEEKVSRKLSVSKIGSLTQKDGLPFYW